MPTFRSRSRLRRRPFRRRPRRPGKWLVSVHDTLNVPNAPAVVGGRGALILSGENDGDGLADAQLPFSGSADLWVRRIIGDIVVLPNYNQINVAAPFLRSFATYGGLAVLDKRICESIQEAAPDAWRLDPQAATPNIQIDPRNEPDARFFWRGTRKHMLSVPSAATTVGYYSNGHERMPVNWRGNAKISDQFCLIAGYNVTDDGGAISGSAWHQLWIYVEWA